MSKKLTYLLVGLCLAVTATGAYADTLEVSPDADTYVMDDTAHGDAAYMFLDNTGNSVGYVRFDLAAANVLTVQDATLMLVTSGGAPRNDNVVAGRFVLHGLNNVAGNTPQNWDEATLSAADVGAEWSTNAGEPLVNTANLDDTVDGISESITRVGANYWDPGAIEIEVSGAPLVNFIQSRVDDNGLVSFILEFPGGGGYRGYGIASKDNETPEWRPVLVLEATTGARTAPIKPHPADGTVEVPRDSLLSWEPGLFAATHDVYMSTGFEDVNATSADVLVAEGLTAASYDPSPLDWGQTYYWRVVEVNAPANPGSYAGPVWSFTTEAYSYLVPDVNVTASVPSLEGSEPINLVNDPNANGTSTAEGTMWSANPGDANEILLDFDLGQVYRLDEMLVWNFNAEYEGKGYLNFSVKDIAVESSIDGDTWTALGDHTLAQGTGTTDNPGQAVKLENAAAQYVRLIAKNTYGGETFGLSEVHFYYIPTKASDPVPAPGTTDLDPDVTVSWTPGREAVSHRVYLGTNANEVADELVSFTTADANMLSLGMLDLGQTYHWKVVEVNDAAQPSTWPGDVWDFTTIPYLVVDDMESYSEEEGNEVFKTWLDGIELGNSGSIVGYNDPPYVDTSTTHSGSQSMPVSYGQNGNFNFSTAQRTFASPQDWTISGVTTLRLYFYGEPGNDPTEPMWIELTDQSGKTGKVTYGTGPAENADNQAMAFWHEWSIPLSEFGINLTRVASMTIGFGDTTATETMGTVIFDDIRLYPPSSAAEAVLAAYWPLDGNAQDSSGNGNDGTLNGGATWTTAGKVGGALSLDGVDAYVDCGNGPSVNITEAITLAAWVNMADAGNGEHNPFVDKGDQGYAIKHNSGNNIETFIYDSGWHTVTYPIDDTWNDEWHHVASTFDGLNIRLYVDGVLRRTVEYSGQIAITDYNVNLGRNSQNTGRLYNGLLDEARIYNGALSPAEVAALAMP